MENKLAIAFFTLAQDAAKLVEITGFLAGAAPEDSWQRRDRQETLGRKKRPAEQFPGRRKRHTVRWACRGSQLHSAGAGEVQLDFAVAAHGALCYTSANDA